MNDEVELPELVLLSDEPTPDHNADGLEMRAYAEVIAGAALGTRGPFTIGVHGKWGEGKTSVLRQARSLTEKANPDAVCVWFNAWQYDHEAYPLVPLALEIAEAVDAKIQAAEERGTLSRWINWREIGTALRALASGLTIKAGIVEYDVSQIFTQIDRAVEADARLPLQPGVFQKAYAFLQQVTTVNVDGPEEERRPPVIVFVDDLDRCLPRHALRLLQAIRLVLNQPGFLFVLALDRDPVVHYLAREYEKLKMAEPDECARNYLDKMIQLPLWIPPHGGRFAGYLGALLDRDELKAHGEVKDALKQLMGLLQTGTEANPRAVVRLVNSLIADRCLWIARGNAVDAEWLGFCAISRVLRDRLGEDTYRTLVWSDRVCERLVQMKSPDELDERRREFAERGLEKLSRRESQEMKLLERIGQSAAVRALLETGIGQEWLRAHPSRREIEGYLAAERRATSAPESGGVMAIERAIRSELSLNDDAPITDVDRNGVEKLSLAFKPVQDDDLISVSRLTSLTSLNLLETQVTDEGLEHLKGLTSLTSLNLWGTQVTDEGLEHLKGLTSLTSLDLSGTQVTDEGLEHLKGLTSLTSLYLSGTQVTDEGLEHLKGLTSLTSLYLSGKQVTDEGLEHLKGLTSLTSLTSLYLSGTQVTDEGIEGLKAAIPGLRVLR